MGLVYNFSTKADGNMSVKWGDEQEVVGNRIKWLGGLGIKYEDCVLADLTGGTDMNIVTKRDKGKLIEGDAMITTENNTALFMVTADCLPVIIYSDKSLALVHLGWKGVDGKLVKMVLKKMGKCFDFLQNYKIIIGPGVRKETYIKYGDKLNEFYRQLKTDKDEWDPFLKNINDKGRVGIDLAGFVIKQAVEAGIARENIQVSPVDTIKELHYFSHYRAGETAEKEGRFGTVAMMT